MRLGYDLLDAADQMQLRIIEGLCTSGGRDTNIVFTPNKKRRQKIDALPYSPMFIAASSKERLSWIQKEISLPLAAMDNNIDILYSPGPSLCLRQPCKTVLVAEDPGPMLFSDEAAKGLENKIRRFFRKKAARKANRLIAHSVFAKKVFQKLLDLGDGRIDIVPLPVSDIFGPVFDGERIQAALKKRNINSQYFIYCGNYFKRNNVRELIEIFIGFLTHKSNSCLVLAGDNICGLDKIKENPSLKNRLIMINNINDDELLLLLNGATAYITTSLFEAFPAQAQKAVACGVPVICYDNSSFTEILANACISIKNGDETSFVKAMREAKDNQNLRLKLKALGIQRAKTFTVERAVACTRKVLEAVGKEGYFPDER